MTKWCEHYVVVDGEKLGPYQSAHRTSVVAQQHASARTVLPYTGPRTEWSCTSRTSADMMTGFYMERRTKRTHQVSIIWDKRTDRTDRDWCSSKQRKADKE